MFQGPGEQHQLPMGCDLVGGKIYRYLGHSFSSEFQLDDFDVSRRVDLDVVFTFCEFSLERGS